MCMCLTRPCFRSPKFPTSYKTCRTAFRGARLRAQEAIEKLNHILRPCRATGYGYKDSRLDHVTEMHLLQMIAMLRHYATEGSADHGRWIDASVSTARALGRQPRYGKLIRKWCSRFIRDGGLPTNKYGSWNTSVLHTDEDLRHEVEAYLRLLGSLSALRILSNA